MVGVGIVFKNGSKMYFKAEEFDIETDSQASGGKPNLTLRKFEYKDVNGNVAPVHLKLDEIAAITVVPIEARGASSLKLI